MYSDISSENGLGWSVPHETVIPPFLDAVDKAICYLDPAIGILGVADFFTSSKFDSSDRQHGYFTRWFWRCVFDLDNIDLGPERRHYLDHEFEKGKFSLTQFATYLCRS